MKLSHLKEIVKYLKQFKKINAIHRVWDSIIKISFDKNEIVYFDMQKSNSTIFKCNSYDRSKIYNAPFDVALAKRLNRAKILHVELVNDDKIIRFKTSLSSSYKQQITNIQFEFTGKNTNVILTDEDGIVIEALRHIDIYSSFREVKVGQKLLDVPKPPFKAKKYPIDNIESFLYQNYKDTQLKKLTLLKKQKLSYLNKKLQKLQKLYNSLEDEQNLEIEAQKYQHYGNLVLVNLNEIKPYQMDIELKDYDGKIIHIKLEKMYQNAAQISDDFFKKAKKAKQKAKNLHIQKTSLKEKIQYINFFINTVTQTNDISKINMLFPKQIKDKKNKQNESVEIFFIEGYKILLGKNEKGNIEVLKMAKAKDVWLHLKDIPSAHVIIVTDKQQIPQNIIESAAKLCVDFSTTQKGRFLVDYTKRREVCIQNKANVLYNNYQTIEVKQG